MLWSDDINNPTWLPSSLALRQLLAVKCRFPKRDGKTGKGPNNKEEEIKLPILSYRINTSALISIFGRLFLLYGWSALRHKLESMLEEKSMII